jgi:DNA repair protein RadC
VIDVAREMLTAGDGTLSDLAMMSVGSLCEINGIGIGKAVTVAAAFELGRRVSLEMSSSPKLKMSSPSTVYKVMLPIFRHLDHEECWIIHLNKSNCLTHKEMITIGGLDSTIIDNRIIIRKAIERKSTGIILVHNHPSGSALPSQADITQTRTLNKALKTCDISLLDHVIIASDNYYSFADEELIEV